jgi:hypothetical protein
MILEPYSDTNLSEPRGNKDLEIHSQIDSF